MGVTKAAPAPPRRVVTVHHGGLAWGTVWTSAPLLAVFVVLITY